MKKNSKILIIVIAAAVLIGAAVFAAIAIGGNSDAKELEEQLVLANRYLQELDYENAVAAFQSALEIDPKSEEAYLGLADAYVGLGDYENALRVLETGYAETGSEALAAKRQEVEQTYAGSQEEQAKTDGAEEDTAGQETEDREMTQWTADFTEEETATLQGIMEALQSEDDNRICDTLLGSDLFALAKKYGVESEWSDLDRFYMDYGDTMNGTGISFEINNRATEPSGVIELYYGGWKDGKADGPGILLYILVEDSEAYDEQYVVARGNWAGGFAEGDSICRLLWFGGAQDGYSDEFSGPTAHGVWNGDVFGKIRKIVDGEIREYQEKSTFSDGVIVCLGQADGGADAYSMNLDSNQLMPYSGFGGRLGEYEASRNARQGVLCSDGPVAAGYDPEDTYMVTSLSYRLANDVENGVMTRRLYRWQPDD